MRAKTTMPVRRASGSPKATAAELTRLKPEGIIVIGVAAVVPKAVHDALGRYTR